VSSIQQTQHPHTTPTRHRGPLRCGPPGPALRLLSAVRDDRRAYGAGISPHVDPPWPVVIGVPGSRIHRGIRRPTSAVADAPVSASGSVRHRWPGARFTPGLHRFPRGLSNLQPPVGRPGARADMTGRPCARAGPAAATSGTVVRGARSAPFRVLTAPPDDVRPGLPPGAERARVPPSIAVRRRGITCPVCCARSSTPARSPSRSTLYGRCPVSHGLGVRPKRRRTLVPEPGKTSRRRRGCCR